MSAVHQWFQRAPRYVFQTEDETLLRFAGMETRGSASQAKIQDLSATGLSFVLSESEITPEEGDMVKIEFSVPGHDEKRRRVACFATVVRIDARQEWNPEFGERSQTLIAVTFRHLPRVLHELIQAGLRGKVHSEEDLEWQKRRGFHMLVFSGICAALWMGFILLATRPEILVSAFYP